MSLKDLNYIKGEPKLRNIIEQALKRGVSYLVSTCKGGRCLEFDSLRFGPSGPWVTSCIGSTLCEFGIRDENMLGYILDSQRRNGGWAYNGKVPADADSTLRVLQFLALYGYLDERVVGHAEQFVLKHQLADGGIATYRPYLLLKLIGRILGSRSIDGWTISNGCVSALALNILREPPQSLESYMEKYILKYGMETYWWRTPLYVANEIDRRGVKKIAIPSGVTESTIELSLRLIMLARRGESNSDLLQQLLEKQLPDGRFAGSNDFRIPRPHQLFEDVTPVEKNGIRIPVEERSLLSTAAATVAISRQRLLVA